MTSKHDQHTIASAYDHWSEFYDTEGNPTRDLDATIVQRLLPPHRFTDRDVLEFGAGTGKNTQWFVPHCRSILALDLSEGMLAKARARIVSPKARFVCHDITEPWPTEPQSADLVVGNLVLEHIRDLRAPLAQAYTALRPGGTLFICEYHPFRQLQGKQARFDDPETGVTNRVPAFTHSISQFITTAVDVGFVFADIGEWFEASDDTQGAPRLLSLEFSRAEAA